MYYINKIVGWVLSPLGVLFLGFVVGICFRRLRGLSRLRSLGSWVIGITLAFIWVMGCGIATRIVGVGLESSFTVEGKIHGDISDLPAADAIVVLGGGMGKHEKCGAAEMYGGADRVWTGAKLWRAGKASVVTLSGGGVEESTVPFMQDLGVPREVMMFFPEARNTEEEARMIAEKGLKRVLLVTSAWHMPRARMLFEHAGLEVIPAPTDFEMSAACERDIEIGEFFPSCEALSRNSWAIKEWVARFCYWLKG